MKRKTMVVLTVLTAAMTLAAATVFAWGPGRGPVMSRGFGPGYGCCAAAVPNLSADQAAKLAKIRSERYAEAEKIRSEMYSRRFELQALLRAPELDKEEIAAKQREIATLQAKNQERALTARTAVAEILTPEQRAQLPVYGPGFRGGRGRGMEFGPRW